MRLQPFLAIMLLAPFPLRADDAVAPCTGPETKKGSQLPPIEKICDPVAAAEGKWGDSHCDKYTWRYMVETCKVASKDGRALCDDPDVQRRKGSREERIKAAWDGAPIDGAYETEAQATLYNGGAHTFYLKDARDRYYADVQKFFHITRDYEKVREACLDFASDPLSKDNREKANHFLAKREVFTINYNDASKEDLPESAGPPSLRSPNKRLTRVWGSFAGYSGGGKVTKAYKVAVDSWVKQLHQLVLQKLEEAKAKYTADQQQLAQQAQSAILEKLQAAAADPNVAHGDTGSGDGGASARAAAAQPDAPQQNPIGAPSGPGTVAPPKNDDPGY